MNVVKEIKRLNEHELKFGITGSASWHDKYKDSAYIYIGNLDYELTEGDILIVFSQFGEIIDINLIRDEETGKSRGFCYLAYEDQRSTNLAVDNFNGAKICDRIITVDHKEGYFRKIKKSKKEGGEEGEEEENEEELKQKVHEHPILLKQLRGELPPDINYISEYEAKQHMKKKKKEERRKRKEEKKRKRKEKDLEREIKKQKIESPSQETKSYREKEKRYRYEESPRRRDPSFSPDRDRYSRSREEKFYRDDRYERRERR